MIFKYFPSGLILTALFCLPVPVLSQEAPEDIAIVADDFQNTFYEALKQKGIENYDKAVLSLEKCLQLQPNNAVIYNELGKNYFAQKKYENTRQSFQKATDLDPKNRWYWVGLYNVYYQLKDYEQSIIVVKKLIEFNKEYREDLVSLYMYTQQFDKALELISELDETSGKSKAREIYKKQISSSSEFKGSEKEYYEAQIRKFPKEESNYISLIFLYSESNEEKKAYAIAKQLEKILPDSDWAQVSLFKFYLNNNDAQKAIKSMNQALASDKVDKKIKHRILNEFLIFANNNSEYDNALEQAIGYLEQEEQDQVTKEIGKFYFNKKNWTKAIHYFEVSLANQTEDIESILLLFQSYTENRQFEVLSKKAETAIDFFPLQPELYYYAGLANNVLKNYKKAKSFLEMGLDYLVDNNNLEINFNIQLGEAYNSLGDTVKKESYFLKADQLLKQKKK